MHDIMTVKEVADYLRVSERTIYDWATKGHIPSGKLGTTWRFKRAEIEQWVNRRLNTVPADSARDSMEKILTPERTLLLKEEKKKAALEKIIDVISGHPAVRNKKELASGIFRREKLMSTGIGLGVAVPHVRLDSIEDLVMAVGISKNGVTDYDSLDGQPVKIICMIAAGKNQHAQHIKTLAEISRKVKDDKLRNSLFNASDEITIYNLITGKN
jgi:PTS system nitrogen regulatory IIA component